LLEIRPVSFGLLLFRSFGFILGSIKQIAKICIFFLYYLPFLSIVWDLVW